MLAEDLPEPVIKYLSEFLVSVNLKRVGWMTAGESFVSTSSLGSATTAKSISKVKPSNKRGAHQN